MERSATCLFGLRQYGVDINGYVVDENGDISVWMQKRSINKSTWPGKLDNFVSIITHDYVCRVTILGIHTLSFLLYVLF